MASTGDSLKRLAMAFTVRDIMVSIPDLICATIESDAPFVSKAYPDFSTIPIKTADGLLAYYSRDSARIANIEIQDVISDGTAVLDLVDVLANREFAFVVGPRQISGYVHFSDLNHHLVKLTFYVLLEALERFALDSVRQRLTSDFLKATLGELRFVQLEQFYRRAADAGQSVVNYLNISDTLKLAKRAGTLEIDEGLIKPIKEVRDGAAHVLENLISNYPDVKKLAEVKRQCLRTLRVD